MSRRRVAVTGTLWLLALAGCASVPPAPAPPPPPPAMAGAPAAAAASPEAPAVAAAASPAAARAPADSAPAEATAPDADPAAPASAGPVWAALAAGFEGPLCPADARVDLWRRLYTRGPDQFATQLEEALPLLAMVLERVRDAGLPTEFALLPIVESNYRPDARNGGTAGMWQFGAPTARAAGLRVAGAVDERRAPLPSTLAAVRLLDAYLQAFGDWRLAVMAYNAGEYRLRRLLQGSDAVAVSAGSGRPRGLSAGTYDHLAKVEALACILARPGAHGLSLPAGPFEPLLPARFPGERLAHALDSLGRTERDAIERLNPRRGWAAAGRHEITVLVPAATMAQLAAAVAVAPSAAAIDAGTAMHRVRAGDTLWALARRYGIPLRRLLEWNRLDPDAPLRVGQELRLEP